LKPKVQAILLADHVYKDEFTGKYVVSGIHNTYLLNPNARPDRVPEDGSAAIPMDMHRAGAPYAYVNLTEFNGKFDFQLRYVSLKDNEVLMTFGFGAKHYDPLLNVQLVFPVPSVPRHRDCWKHRTDCVAAAEQADRTRLSFGDPPVVRRNSSNQRGRLTHARVPHPDLPIGQFRSFRPVVLGRRRTGVQQDRRSDAESRGRWARHKGSASRNGTKRATPAQKDASRSTGVVSIPWKVNVHNVAHAMMWAVISLDE
jgi:hypothetical protein